MIGHPNSKIDNLPNPEMEIVLSYRAKIDMN